VSKAQRGGQGGGIIVKRDRNKKIINMFIKTNCNNKVNLLKSLNFLPITSFVKFSTLTIGEVGSPVLSHRERGKLTNFDFNLIQSAGNLRGSSETIRKLSEKEKD
jgi:hypothetical protein